MDVLIQNLIIVALLWILGRTSVEDVMSNHGQNLLNSLTDMTEYSKINVNRLIVGNLTICQAHINALMEIMR